MPEHLHIDKEKPSDDRQEAHEQEAYGQEAHGQEAHEQEAHEQEAHEQEAKWLERSDDSPLEQFVACLQSVNRHLRSSVFEQEGQPVTRVQWMLLRRVQRNGDSTIGQLAAQLDVRASTMSQMLDRLQKQGYVTRKQDATDARVKLIRLTAHGERVMEQTEAVWRQSLAQPFSELAAREQEALVALMQKLAGSLPRREEG